MSLSVGVSPKGMHVLPARGHPSVTDRGHRTCEVMNIRKVDSATGMAATGSLLSLQAAAEELGVCVRTVRRHISRGELPAYRVGPRLLRVNREDLEAVMSPVPSGGGTTSSAVRRVARG